MKILIAPDKFKGSLSAHEVCLAVGRGLGKSGKSIEISFHPMADGGDGSLEVLYNHLKLEVHTILTTDLLGRNIRTQYYTSSEAAFIEVASASGLVLLAEEERNPLLTSTYGTGKMMADAMNKGFKNIHLFLGGSGTNDAGMGIASALGCTFFDEKKNQLSPMGGNLKKIHSIKPSHLFDFNKINLTLLCDVTNPLFGKSGAAHVYARQKGANEKQVFLLDQGLRHFSKIIHKQTGIDASKLPGSGAAGGIGAGLIPLFGAKLKSGFDVISELTGLENKIKSTDWVISGEGKIDTQSIHGKVVSGLEKLCGKYKKPLTLFVGKNDLTDEEREDWTLSQIYSVSELAKDKHNAMTNGAEYLEELAYKFMNES